jgi:hypothetical protein
MKTESQTCTLKSFKEVASSCKSTLVKIKRKHNGWVNEMIRYCSRITKISRYEQQELGVVAHTCVPGI